MGSGAQGREELRGGVVSEARGVEEVRGGVGLVIG